MIMMVRELELIDQGLEEGLQKGLQKGLEKGLQKGLQKGREEGRLESIRKLILKIHVTPQEAMSLLDIPPEEQATYLEALESATV